MKEDLRSMSSAELQEQKRQHGEVLDILSKWEPLTMPLVITAKSRLERLEYSNRAKDQLIERLRFYSTETSEFIDKILAERNEG